MHYLSIALVVVTSGLLFACSAGTAASVSPDGGGGGTGNGAVPTIDAKDYNQTCTADSDCVVVNEGLCDPCNSDALPKTCGGTAAVNSSDSAKFASDFGARSKSCAVPAEPVGCSAICAENAAYCNAGKCAACFSMGCATKDAGSEAAHD